MVCPPSTSSRCGGPSAASAPSRPHRRRMCIARHRSDNGGDEFSLWRGETPIPKGWSPSVVPGVRTVATPLLSAEKVGARKGAWGVRAPMPWRGCCGPMRRRMRAELRAQGLQDGTAALRPAHWRPTARSSPAPPRAASPRAGGRAAADLRARHGCGPLWRVLLQRAGRHRHGPCVHAHPHGGSARAAGCCYWQRAAATLRHTHTQPALAAARASCRAVPPPPPARPQDDHMVHRGHAVFDTVLITDGHLYQLPEHVARFKVGIHHDNF